MHAHTVTEVPLVYICDICNESFPTNKSMLQHRRIKHKSLALPALCLPDTSTCPVCGTDFEHRLAVITHLCDLRVRSRIRGTCCGLLYLGSSPVPLAPSLAEALNSRDRVLRSAALKEGHTHALIKRPAASSSKKCSRGIATSVLSQVVVGGMRRRLSTKTPPIIANLKFKPRTYVAVDQDGHPRRRVGAKSCPVFRPIGVVIRKRPYCKTTVVA